MQKARAEHLAAHGKLSYSAPYGLVYGSPVYSTPGHYEVPQIAPNGIPLDTHEVSAAKAKHFAAYAEAAARNGVLVGPIDTPEVQHAKALHFAAHPAQAAARNSHGVHHYRKRRSIYGPWAYPQHVPVIGPNGKSS